MTKIQVNSQGKAYLTSGGKVLLSAGGGDTIQAINNTGAAISSGDKVFIAPLSTPQSGANYELIQPKASTNPMFGFLTVGSGASDFSVNTTYKTISQFNYDRWLRVPKVMDYSSAWELNLCFNSGNDVYGTRYYWTGNNNSETDCGVMVAIYEGKIKIRLYDANENADITTFYSYDVFANSTYYVKVGWTGTQYYARYSEDGTTWTDDTPVTSSVAITQSCSGIYIGNNRQDSWSFIKGEIYMDKTYLTSGDGVQWQMYSDGASNLGSNVLTGKASANIASGAVGNVETIVLGE